MAQLFTNNASTTLSAALTDVGTSMSVVTGEGALFQAPTGGDYELIALTDGTNIEIVKSTARSTDAFTIARAQEGTTAQAWAAGTIVEARLTAATLDQFPQGFSNSGNARGANAVNLQPGRSVVSNVASGNSAVAVGYSTKASASYTTALGVAAAALSQQSTALGAYSRSYNITNSLVVNQLPSMQHPFNWLTGAEYTEYNGLVGMIESEPMDLTGGAAWTSATAVSHGRVMRPTTPNGWQYVRWDSGYDIWTDPTLAGYTPGSTGGTEPTWPTALGGSVTDGGGDWVAIPNDGTYIMALPADMLVDEVLFICYEATAITAQSTISIGTTGDLTKIVNAQPTVALTADKTVTRWALTHPVMVPDISIKIDTLATGTKMLGRFIFKGFYAKTWL